MPVKTKKSVKSKLVASEKSISNEDYWNTYPMLSNHNLENPTRTFEVGERVVYGNIENAEVIHCYPNGTHYRLRVWGNKKAYVKPIPFEENRLVSWVDILKVNDCSKIPRISERDWNGFVLLNKTISGVLNNWYRCGIDVNPEYQRGNVWNSEQKHTLLNSIFINIEIGKLAMVKLPFSSDKSADSYELIDGKQRLSTIIDFYEDRISYNGLRFSEMNPHDRNHFMNCPIQILECDRPMTRKQKFEYFIRLNTNGSPMDPKHMANVISKYEKMK